MEERHEMKIESPNHRLQAEDALNMLSLRQSPSAKLKSKGYGSASLYRNAHGHWITLILSTSILCGLSIRSKANLRIKTVDGLVDYVTNSLLLIPGGMVIRQISTTTSKRSTILRRRITSWAIFPKISRIRLSEGVLLRSSNLQKRSYL
jgi:hypothetical protein